MSSFVRAQKWIVLLVMLGTMVGNAEARDAAFMDPGLTSTGAVNANEDAIAVEPKGEIDTGESQINVERRTTLFFVNRSGAPVDVVSVTTSSDGTVKSDIAGDDCTTQGKIDPSSRCAVVVGITPSTPGTWSVEVLMTHKGSGRLARAKLTGKASGLANANKQDTGLSLSTKDNKPVDFGQVVANGGKAVRSALMLNDSPEPITLMSIDVIAAENGLERLDQGCMPDMELKTGESCPVTMVWQPTSKGQISTDLIIRHTGRMGFAVIPLRGVSKEDANEVIDDKGGKAPPSLSDVDSAALSRIPPLSADLLPSRATTPAAPAAPVFRLIGTVGNRAILLTGDGETVLADLGEEITYNNTAIKITNVMPKAVEIFIAGEKQSLSLEAARSLTKKASQAAEMERAAATAAAAAAAESTTGKK